MCCCYGTSINNIRTIYVPLAGRRRHRHRHRQSIRAAAVAHCPYPLPLSVPLSVVLAMRRRETGASGHQRVWPTWAPSHFMCAEFHFVATTKTTTTTTAAKRGNKQNKLKSSQSPNLIYALYAHKNVKNCVATAPAPAPCPFCPVPIPHTWLLCVRRFVWACVLLAYLLDMNLGC